MSKEEHYAEADASTDYSDSSSDESDCDSEDDRSFPNDAKIPALIPPFIRLPPDYRTNPHVMQYIQMSRVPMQPYIMPMYTQIHPQGIARAIPQQIPYSVPQGSVMSTANLGNQTQIMRQLVHPPSGPLPPQITQALQQRQQMAPSQANPVSDDFVCGDCGRSFKQRRGLTVHRNVSHINKAIADSQKTVPKADMKRKFEKTVEGSAPISDETGIGSGPSMAEPRAPRLFPRKLSRRL